ncbi:hypothetical protein PO909_023929 [Leuciscus waleckii]
MLKRRMQSTFCIYLDKTARAENVYHSAEFNWNSLVRLYFDPEKVFKRPLGTAVSVKLLVNVVANPKASKQLAESRNWAERHDNDPKHTAKMTTALLRKLKLKVKVMDWPSISPDLYPIEHLWVILKRKVEKRHVSNIQQLRDVIMEEWKRIPATTCAALVNSMPRRIKAVHDNVHNSA